MTASKKTTRLLICILLSGCATNIGLNRGDYSNGYYRASYSQKHFDSAPREGWATDPIFSYNLYSYYPMDFYHGGFFQSYYHY